MSKRDMHSDEAILEYWQALQQVLGCPLSEEQQAALDAAVEAQKAREAKAWWDTTQDTPLFGK